MDIDEPIWQQTAVTDNSEGPDMSEMYSTGKRKYSREIEMNPKNIKKLKVENFQGLQKGNYFSPQMPDLWTFQSEQPAIPPNPVPPTMNGILNLCNSQCDFQEEPDLSVILEVYNLHCCVTNAHLKELFEVFGPLRNVAVCYDIQGRSLGTAVVIYERYLDGHKALAEYNNKTFYGKLMKIKFTISGGDGNDFW